MLTKIPEINPLELLYQQYHPLNKQELAELLGVSPATVCKWSENKRNPATPVRKLAYLILQEMRSQSLKVA